jgi:hypothetical protein
LHLRTPWRSHQMSQTSPLHPDTSFTEVKQQFEHTTRRADAVVRLSWSSGLFQDRGSNEFVSRDAKTLCHQRDTVNSYKTDEQHS